MARVDLAVGIAPGVEQALVVARLLVALVEQPAADELVPARRALLEAVDRLEHTEHERTPVVVAAEVVARRSGDVDLLVEVGPQERVGVDHFQAREAVRCRLHRDDELRAVLGDEVVEAGVPRLLGGNGPWWSMLSSSITVLGRVPSSCS
jgi:hypothetical protein